jgi:hypothetical protein
VRRNPELRAHAGSITDNVAKDAARPRSGEH